MPSEAVGKSRKDIDVETRRVILAVVVRYALPIAAIAILVLTKNYCL
jgi:hypothetical protein